MEEFRASEGVASSIQPALPVLPKGLGRECSAEARLYEAVCVLHNRSAFLGRCSRSNDSWFRFNRKGQETSHVQIERSFLRDVIPGEDWLNYRLFNRDYNLPGVTGQFAQSEILVNIQFNEGHSAGALCWVQVSSAGLYVAYTAIDGEVLEINGYMFKAHVLPEVVRELSLTSRELRDCDPNLAGTGRFLLGCKRLLMRAFRRNR